MGEEYVPTVRIRRQPKVTTDDRGRTVWADTVETLELELVSTGELQKILASTDDTTRTAIEEVIADEQEGVLARDPATGLFEIISDAELQEVLKNSGNLPKTTRPADVTLEPVSSSTSSDELSLVSTQVLRKILKQDPPKEPKKKATPALKTDKGGGFDPYNSG